MKTAFKAVAGLLVLLVVVAACIYEWASVKDRALLARTIETHSVDFPIPFPLTEAEIAEVTQAQASMANGANGANGDLMAEVDLDAIGLARAVERGDHLVQARDRCVECHGQNFGGGVMVDDPMLGRLLGPNITAGPGGRTADYSAADWDRIVRHGVRPDGHPAAMPSSDFQRMSDQELSDVVAYIRSRPGGDPSWPPVANLTPTGRPADWTGEQFATVLRTAMRPDGTELLPPMSLMAVYAQHMTDTEISAFFLYLKSLPATPTP